jgi:CDP-diacylglycerol--glycerol-3-phosphate 3-phosphatidyltransferase
MRLPERHLIFAQAPADAFKLQLLQSDREQPRIGDGGTDGADRNIDGKAKGDRLATLYALKPRFQALLRPLVGRMAASGITANQVTIGACAGSVVVGLLLIRWGATLNFLFLLIPAWLFLRMAFNAVDGMLAREFSQKSRLGAYLNEITDVLSDALLYAPFALLAPFAPLEVGLVILLAALSEMAGLQGLTLGASRRYDGPFGKSDRALAFGALGLWVGIGGERPDWLHWLMPLMALLLAVTIINRVRNGLAEAHETMPN